jgi:hypothetical protein
MQASRTSKFSAMTSQMGKKTKTRQSDKQGADKKQRASKSSKFDTKTLLPKSDASSDEFDFEQKEKKHKQELKEVDLMYLINDDRSEDDFLGRGAKATNKGKQHQNLAPLKSPFIQRNDPESGQ